MPSKPVVDGASAAIAPARACSAQPFLLAAALFVGLAGSLASQPARAQSSGRIACPERLKTVSAQIADRSVIAGFTEVLGGDTTAQSWLQDVALYAAADETKALSGKADGRRRIVWTLDGATDVLVGCIYEGGITLTRAAGKPKSCTASILRSKDAKAGGWGMERADFTCR